MSETHDRKGNAIARTQSQGTDKVGTEHDDAKAVSREQLRRDASPGAPIAEEFPVPLTHQIAVEQSGRLSIAPARRARRYVKWAVVGSALLLVCVPVGLWLYYQSVHVMSRNAIVKRHIAEIGSRVTSVVTRFEVEPGDQVAAGQVLAHLEDRHFRAEVQDARAQVDGLERALEVERLSIAHEQRRLEIKMDETLGNLAAAEADVAAARSQANIANEYYNTRKSLLLAGGAISKEDVRTSNTNAQTARSLLKAARAKHAVARSARESSRLESEGIRIRRRKVGVLEADLLRARARLARAEADLEAALIRAPDSGAVVRWLVPPGGSIDNGQPIISMWLGQDVWIEVWIDEDELAEVKVGSEATVTLQSFPGRQFTGRVDKISLTTDFEMPESEVPQPRFSRMRGAPVIGLIVRLDNPPVDLLPGMSAVVGIRKPLS